MNTTKLPRYLSYIAAFIIILVPFQGLITAWAGSNFGHVDLIRIWKELLMVPLTLGTVYLVYRDKKLLKWFFNSPLVLLILIYTLLQVGLGIWAWQTGRVNSSAYIYALLINVRFFVFFLICLILASRSDWLKLNWEKIILWPAAIVVSFGLLQHFVLKPDFLRHFGYGPRTIPTYQAVDKKPDFIRAQSTLRGANPLGAYLVVILTILSAFWLRQKNKLKLSVAILASLIVLYFSYSRSAYLGLIVSGLLLGFWSIQNRRARQGLIIGSIIGLTLLVTVIGLWSKNSVVSNTLFHTSSSSQSLESSNAVRSEAMLDGAKSILKQPFGGGPGTAGPASTRNNRPARIAENYFIQVGQEVGIIGLLLFIAINIYVAKMLWDDRRSDLALIALAALVGLTLVNCLSHAWADDTLAYLYWGLAGIALAPSVILKTGTKPKHAKVKEKPAKRTNQDR